MKTFSPPFMLFSHGKKSPSYNLDAIKNVSLNKTSLFFSNCNEQNMFKMSFNLSDALPPKALMLPVYVDK